ncbi:hypothetical protein EON82_22535 [bacterium]|nr:MAG: hypothetical protein EON82_22535 [bacterium]
MGNAPLSPGEQREAEALWQERASAPATVAILQHPAAAEQAVDQSCRAGGQCGEPVWPEVTLSDGRTVHKGADGAWQVGRSPGACFVAGTPVLVPLENGTGSRPIETIEPGDFVLAAQPDGATVPEEERDESLELPPRDVTEDAGSTQDAISSPLSMTTWKSAPLPPRPPARFASPLSTAAP